MKPPHNLAGDRFHAVVLLMAAILICAYWIAFFHSDLTKPDFVRLAATPAQARLSAVYMGFESAFPLPDMFVAVTSAVAALYLARQDPKALLFGIVSGGGLMFLALIDINFNILHGFYTASYLAADSGMQLEALINLACVCGAAWSIWRLWQCGGRTNGFFSEEEKQKTLVSQVRVPPERTPRQHK